MRSMSSRVASARATKQQDQDGRTSGQCSTPTPFGFLNGMSKAQMLSSEVSRDTACVGGYYPENGLMHSVRRRKIGFKIR